MTGKRAAAALMQFDLDLAAEVATLDAQDCALSWDEAESFARHAFGLWTLSLAAAAAGVTEEMTIAALMYNHLRVGTNLVCQGVAKSACRKGASNVSRQKRSAA